MWSRLEPYRSSIILLVALVIGGLLGIYAPSLAGKLQPIGQIFLNLLFMIIVPLVGISVMSSIASMTDLKRLGRIMAIIFIVSIAMAFIPAAGIVALALWYNPAQGVTIDLSQSVQAGSGKMDFVSMITTSDFIGLFSKSNILALIVMAIIAGVAIGQSDQAGKRIASLLEDANTVIMKIVSIIMKVAPIGLGCYFAATMASQDSALLLTFARAIGLFMVATLVYFVFGSILYSYIGGGIPAVKAFWRNAIEPSATALGTCSSLGTLPVTLRAGKAMGINPEIVDVSIPLLVNLKRRRGDDSRTENCLYLFRAGYGVHHRNLLPDDADCGALRHYRRRRTRWGVPWRDLYRHHVGSADGSDPDAGGTGHHYRCASYID